MDPVQLALGRALAFACGSAQFDSEILFHRLAWELHHVASKDIAALAILLRRPDGSFCIAKSKETQTLPPETLLALMVEEGGTSLRCRVRDHALDTVRFIDSRLRASILVSVKLPSTLGLGSECVIWSGLYGVASRASVEASESIGRALGEWLDVYSSVIDAAARSDKNKSELQNEVSRLRGVVHDARAPLGILKYSAREMAGGQDGSNTLYQELEYLERLLARGAPEKSVAKDPETSDVGAVLRRVQARFRERVAGAPEVLLRTEYEIGRVVIREIDLERVVTNLVGNATRYAPQGRILIEAEPRESSVLVRIRDNGEGIPATIMERVLQGRGVDSGGSGWGVGLISCKAMIESAGGWFDIEVGIEGGSTVSFSLVRSSEEAIAEPVMAVAERQVPEKRNGGVPHVFVVDDDVEHGESLARILSARGVDAACFNSVSECLSSGALSASSIVLCDAHMPAGGAEKLLSFFLTRADRPCIAAMSGDGSDDLVYRLAALGARGFFAKPVAIEEILDWIEHARNQASMRRAC